MFWFQVAKRQSTVYIEEYWEILWALKAMGKCESPLAYPLYTCRAYTVSVDLHNVNSALFVSWWVILFNMEDFDLDVWNLKLYKIFI